MGRTAASPDKSRTKIKWSSDDTIELFANLDFIVKKVRENGGWAGKKEVLQKLQPRLKKRRTVGQIENKIKFSNGSAGPKALEDIYRHGSRRIRSLDSDLKLRIQEELKSIKSKEVCIVVSTPRQLRSASQHLSIEASRSRRGSTIFGERTPTRSMPRTRRGDAEDLVSKIGENESQSSKQNPVTQDTIIVSRQIFNSRRTTKPPSISVADTEERIKSSPSCDTYRESSAHEVCSLDGTTAPPSAVRSSFYAAKLNDAVNMDYDDPDTIMRIPDDAIIGCSHETLKDLFSDNLYFRKKWSDSEERREKIDQHDRLKHSILAQGSVAVSLTMADTIETQNEKIINLQRQLSSQKFLNQFLTLGRGKEVPLNQAQIQIDHKIMRKQFRSLSMMNCFQHPRDTSAIVDSHDLNKLKSLVLSDLHCYPIGLAIQSLIGAAVCEWVFNEKMQSTSMMSSPLLEGYRHQLGTACGELVLRNVDLAAHQWVINEDKHFQEQFLPRTAIKLSDRLFNALGPFMKNNEKTGPKLRIRLESIFCTALKIKTFAMIGNNVFESIWPAHNSTFEGDFMEEEPPEGAAWKQTPSKHGVKRVLLAVVPGLRVYSDDRKLVDYHGFTKGDEEGLEQPSLVAQAVVVTQ